MSVKGGQTNVGDVRDLGHAVDTDPLPKKGWPVDALSAGCPNSRVIGSLFGQSR